MVTLRAAQRAGRRPCARPGFTLIELLVVLAIVALLLTLAVPRYFISVDTARAAVTRANLATLRETIDHFFQDTGAYPESLEELVEKRYLRNLPPDPASGTTASWVIVAPEGGTQGRVFDVRSAAGPGPATAQPGAQP